MNQSELIFLYFQQNPNRNIPHQEVVDWAVSEWNNITGKVLRDPDRAIRKMAQSGQLIKVGKGLYKYDPALVHTKNLEDFSVSDKKKILKRDNYSCVLCGKGRKDGVELHIDHIKPKDLDGKAILANGQTLCAQHNFQKKRIINKLKLVKNVYKA